MPNQNNMNKPADEYWASLDREFIGSQLSRQIEQYDDYVETSGRLSIWRECHHSYNEALRSGVDINQLGQLGELSEIRVNHVRNLQTHIVNLTLAQRPAWQPRAINSDYKSQSQTNLARGILDYEMSERELEKRFRTASNYAMTYGDSAVMLVWDSRGGEPATRIATDVDGNEISEEIPNERTGKAERIGEITYRAIPPFDVIRDVNASSIQNQDWYIIRDYINRYDLIAKYADSADIDPEGFDSKELFEDAVNQVEEVRLAILNASPKSELDSSISIGISEHSGAESDLIPVYYFFHKVTPSMPDGRFVLSTGDGEVILEDNPLPYEEVPVYFIFPSETFNEPFGYTPVYDILSISKAYNATISTIVTNQRAFGVQNITVPVSGQINAASLVGGMNFIPYVADEFGGRPEVLKLLATEPEIFTFAETLEQLMETLMGVSSVTRGDPSSNLKSGAALALIASQSIQFTQEFQQSYIHCLEKVGTAIINIYKLYADTPRTIAIVGKAKQHLLTEFTLDDISYIDRVSVDVGSAIAKTAAGKLTIAEDLINLGFIKSPEEFLAVLETGQLESLVQGPIVEMLQIQEENEALQQGKVIPVIVTDDHFLHIKEHKAVLSSVTSRESEELVKNTLDHIKAHLDILQDPDMKVLNGLLGQPDIPAQIPTAPTPGVTDAQAAKISNTAKVVDNANPLTGQFGDTKLPNLPNMPTNPLTGETFTPEDGGDPTNII